MSEPLPGMVNSEKLESLQVPHPPKEHLKPGNYFINPESRAFAKSYLSTRPISNKLANLYDSDHLQKIVHFASCKLFFFFFLNFFLHKSIYCHALNKNDLYLTRVGLICRGTGRT